MRSPYAPDRANRYGAQESFDSMLQAFAESVRRLRQDGLAYPDDFPFWDALRGALIAAAETGRAVAFEVDAGAWRPSNEGEAHLLHQATELSRAAKVSASSPAARRRYPTRLFARAALRALNQWQEGSTIEARAGKKRLPKQPLRWRADWTGRRIDES